MHRDFRLFWLGQTSSTFGTVFTITATGLVAVRVLGATPAQSGILSASGWLPTLLFGLLAGALADRMTRPRRALIGANLVGAAAVGAVASGFGLGWATIWWLVALNLVLGALKLVVETVYFIHLRGIVADGDLVRSRARLQSGEYAAGVLGRALVGPVIAVAGSVSAFVVDAVSYLVSLVTLLRLRTPDSRRLPAGVSASVGDVRTLVPDIAEGCRTVLRDSFLGPVVAYLAVQAISLGAVAALTAQFLIRVLDVPTAVYGLLFVLVGLGGIAGSLVGGRLAGRRVPVHRLTVAGLAGAAVSTALLPMAGGPLVVAAAVAAAGIGVPVFFGALANVGLTAVITAEVPEERLGRVVTTMQTLVTAAQLVGALAGGVAGGRIGIHPALWAACLLPVAGLALAVPLVRASRPSHLVAP